MELSGADSFTGVTVVVRGDLTLGAECNWVPLDHHHPWPPVGLPAPRPPLVAPDVVTGHDSQRVEEPHGIRKPGTQRRPLTLPPSLTMAEVEQFPSQLFPIS